jgi:hypothetical protein
MLIDKLGPSTCTVFLCIVIKLHPSVLVDDHLPLLGDFGLSVMFMNACVLL